MLITDAVQRVRSATLSASRKVGLVCSFEPLHLRTFLQAFLIARLPEDTPEVVTFGYDQLREAFAETSSVLRTSPVLWSFAWPDIHPALSWRTRSRGAPGRDDLAVEAEKLRAAATAWITARRGAETFIAPPPLDFLPLLDPSSPLTLGDTAVSASALAAGLLVDLSQRGARVLRVPSFDLNFRDLLLSGNPLATEHAEYLARTFVDAAFPETPRKKVIVTDLDGTLWHGVIGEDGPAGLACGPEGKGYPFHVFQEFLLKLKREGILLAFCSKNNPDDVLPIFDTLDMPLKLSDFSAYRCDWQPKSAGLQAIARELHIAPDAIIVIDDDAAEIAEIRQGVPDALTCHTPRDGQQWRELLFRLQALCSTWTVSDEDTARSAAMAMERQRPRLTAADPQQPLAAGALTHLRDMHLELTIQEHAFDDSRSSDLINRTNQFNLSGERFAPDQWLDWAATPGAFCWSVRLRDRFGDFGTICVVTGRAEGPSVHLRQFVLSCRALGRGVETIVLGELLTRLAAVELRGPFRSSGRNEPARTFLAGLGCDIDAAGTWHVEPATVINACRIVLEQTHASVASAAAPDLTTTA